MKKYTVTSMYEANNFHVIVYRFTVQIRYVLLTLELKLP